ncbi:MAG: ferric iron uptake transcriptional regulator [Candidatus Sedimenticola endophacoides]|uniref:Ferric uptake regulation protein n=1 Tax=Candidatus Sedimenticola endophacoides TaxID=2548426 RepID=A0A6N4DRZ3_9GAMM|nr:MAG: ferric iron uptake transcriptional regulator [Candidatus Sedimenticola endophacoides]OQX33685.1 MAG: ferric iron uptake transcriptional regulator [Candidatus Sedimenticola endophacoides]OQX38573.1 MAG: ferric iron uptake transcriptional regulator [Candidatus Sedimenticola endophacoides]OQX44195.1 MAG: ferric iron uptake transcriptional regulator [Candidatus Sedimenticola endophacoides]PUE01101.1 MAG: ferric iron uptake transcriptional regulator [Candidatus Sedimenticola endophacoides]
MKRITKKLKDAGLKVTAARMKILELLESNRGTHASAEELYRMMLERGEDIGIATLYRVLTQCEQAGLVERLQFEGGRAVFEIAEESHHDHIVCVRCGQVQEFHDEVIEARQREVARDAGFEMEDHSMVLYGLCPGCRGD